MSLLLPLRKPLFARLPLALLLPVPTALYFVNIVTDD